MSDEKALLVTIREHPDEDTPRLAYADWLEETSKPANIARAEFIRLQCHPADPTTTGHDPNRGRVLELLARRGFTWLGPLRKIAQGPSAHFLRWDFGRGFVEKLTFPASIAPDHLCGVIREAVRVTPLLRLRAHPHYPNSEWTDPDVGLMRDAGLVALAGCPELASVRSLELNDLGASPAGIRALVDSPHLRGLTWLDVRRSGSASITITDESEQALRHRFAGALQVGRVGDEYLNLGDAYTRTFRAADHAFFRILYGDSAGAGPPVPFPLRKRWRG